MCDAIERRTGLQCIKKDGHYPKTVHQAERDKPVPIYNTHRAKDVYLWWDKEFSDLNRTPG
jgi:hypothetical protein